MINKRNGRFEIESEGRKRNHKWEFGVQTKKKKKEEDNKSQGSEIVSVFVSRYSGQFNVKLSEA